MANSVLTSMSVQISQNLQESFCVLDLRQPLQERNHSPEDVHVPIAGTCEYVMLCGNRGFAEGMEDTKFKVSWLICGGPA